jgi:hypothetical protein
MEEGWIKLHRKMIEWEWYTDNNTKIVFIHLLLTANHAEKNWKGILVKRGQTVTSLQHLAKETRLTLAQVRTALFKLKTTHEITINSTKQYSLINVEKYDNYQCDTKENNTRNTHRTTNK